MNKKIDFFNGNNKKIEPIDKDYMSQSTKKQTGAKKSKVVKTTEAPTTSFPKRRGRRPKKIIESMHAGNLDASDEGTNNTNNASVILRLNIDPSKLGLKNKKPPTEVIRDNKIDSDVESDNSSEGMFKNDIPMDNICHECSKHSKMINYLKSKLDKYEKKDNLDKLTKIYHNKLNFISYTTGKKIVLKKTNIHCWYDGCPFSTLPCVLPELYYNNTYYVFGCFCSYNCALAYNLYVVKDSKIYYRKSLVFQLYREMYGLSSDEPVDIKEAPYKEILSHYGGEMSIDVFRRSFAMNKEYVLNIPPIKPINIIIEEKDADEPNDDKEFILKRSKPLTKKRSILSSMNMKNQ